MDGVRQIVYALGTVIFWPFIQNEMKATEGFSYRSSSFYVKKTILADEHWQMY